MKSVYHEVPNDVTLFSPCLTHFTVINRNN